jgi:hypothetical protein
MHTPNQPRNIIGPSGATVRPQIKQIKVGDEIRTEAHYTDPNTGQFITKIPVSVRKIDDK